MRIAASIALARSRVKRFPARLFGQAGNDRRDECRRKVASGSAAQDNQKFSAAHLSRDIMCQIREAEERHGCEPVVPVVSPVSVEAEIPHHQVRVEFSCPVRESHTHQVEVRLIGGSIQSRWIRGRNVYLHSVCRGVIRVADTDVQCLGILRHEIPRPVGMMGIRVQDGYPAKPPDASCLAERDDHIVEAAIASEEVSPRVVAASPDQAEGIAQRPRADKVHAFHYAPHGGACRRSERIRLHLRDQVRVVGQKDQLVADRFALEEFDVRQQEERAQGARKICEATASRQIAPAAEGGMVEDPGDTARRPISRHAVHSNAAAKAGAAATASRSTIS